MQGIRRVSHNARGHIVEKEDREGQWKRLPMGGVWVSLNNELICCSKRSVAPVIVVLPKGSNSWSICSH